MVTDATIRQISVVMMKCLFMARTVGLLNNAKFVLAVHLRGNDSLSFQKNCLILHHFNVKANGK